LLQVSCFNQLLCCKILQLTLKEVHRDLPQCGDAQRLATLVADSRWTEEPCEISERGRVPWWTATPRHFEVSPPLNVRFPTADEQSRQRLNRLGNTELA